MSMLYYDNDCVSNRYEKKYLLGYVENFNNNASFVVWQLKHLPQAKKSGADRSNENVWCFACDWLMFGRFLSAIKKIAKLNEFCLK